MPALFFSLAGLLALGFSRRHAAGAAAAGLCFALAAGFHLTAGLLLVLGAVWLLLQRRPWRHVLLFAAVFALALALPLWWVAAAKGVRVTRWAWSSLFADVSYTEYAVSDWSPLSGRTLRLCWDGMAGAILVPAGQVLRWASRLILLALAAAGALSLTRRRRQPATLLLALWLAAFALFFTLWHPGATEFKLPVLAPLILLACGFLSTPSRRAPARICALTLAAALLALNFLYGLQPRQRPESNRDLLLAEAIRAATPPNAALVIAGNFRGFGMGKIYIPYFSLRPVLVLDWLVRGRSYAPVLARLRRETMAGRSIHLFSDMATVTPAVEELLHRHLLKAEQHRAFLAQLRLGRRVALPGGAYLVEVSGFAAAAAPLPD